MIEKKRERVLQLNLDGTGGAFSLIYQLQEKLESEFVFDFYWMGKFVRTKKSLDLEDKGCRIYEDDLRKNRLIGHFLQPFVFYKFLKKHAYQIVHINADLAYKMLIYALPAKKAGVKKIILHSHSSGVNGKFKTIKLLSHKICKPFIQAECYIHLTCSELASKWMFDNKNKVTMINNGVDLDKYTFSQIKREKMRNCLGVNNIVLGTVGNLSYQKYPEYLIDIIAAFANQEEYTLLFVGDGPDREVVEKYAKNKHVEKRCIFYGSTDNVVDLLDAMDIFIMTSRFEGLPVSAIEAQANGLPCILSDKVTTETKVLDSCEFASIDNNLSTWVNLIKKVKLNNNRQDAVKVLKDKKFDIRDSADELRKIYKYI